MTTEYEYEVQGYYSKTYGWECVACHPTRNDAQLERALYDREEPEYRHRIKRVRVATVLVTERNARWLVAKKSGMSLFGFVDQEKERTE